MSHFLVGVFCTDIEDVDNLLAPYDEQNEDYFEFQEDASEDLETLRKNYEEDEEKDDMTFEDWLGGYNGCVLRDGKLGYMTNPNAKWDWYDADGGRWRNAGLYRLKPGEKPDEWNRVKVKQMDFSPNQEEYRQAETFWDEYVEGKAPEKYPHAFLKPEYYRRTYGTKEFYVSYNADVTRPYAFVTPDGEWHEQGQMGWFGISTDTQESIAQNADDWQEAIQDYQGLYLVYVDCHI